MCIVVISCDVYRRRVAPQLAEPAGNFEVRLLSLRNPRGQLATGRCCDGARGDTPEGVRCQDACDTYLRACLREYLERRDAAAAPGPCAYGAAASRVLAGDSAELSRRSKAGKMTIPFDFAWPTSFTLILEAWDYDNDTAQDAGSELIERVVYGGALAPLAADSAGSATWRTVRHVGTAASIVFQLRVRCQPRYHGAACTRFCRARDDHFGHFACDAAGNKACLHGWMGPECDQGEDGVSPRDSPREGCAPRRVMLGWEGEGSAQEHWRQTLTNPDKVIAMWHQLNFLKILGLHVLTEPEVQSRLKRERQVTGGYPTELPTPTTTATWSFHHRPCGISWCGRESGVDGKERGGGRAGRAGWARAPT
ncbi:unnamed protein product [Lampetra planeri]